MSRQYRRKPSVTRRSAKKKQQKELAAEQRRRQEFAVNQAEQRRAEDEKYARQTLDLIERLIDAKIGALSLPYAETDEGKARLDTVREALVAELLAK